MQNIRSENTVIEKMMFSQLKQYRLKFKKHYGVAGRPDIAFPDKKVAVFLDSDFWHGWHFNKTRNKLPVVYWRGKIEGNIARDRRNFYRLRRSGWKVVRLWEHQILENPELCAKRIKEIVKT